MNRDGTKIVAATARTGGSGMASFIGAAKKHKDW
jgi:hypothetical protein